MDDLETFIAVVDGGSFTAAARKLDTTVTAVSRRIKALEQRLGTRLLNRTTRQVSLTEAGQLYHGRVRRVLEELRDVESELGEFGTDPGGQLRLTAPMSFGIHHLGPLVAEFAILHPRIEIELQLDDRTVDIVEAGLDMALRIGHLRDSSLVARPLTSIARVICAAPAYLEQRGVPGRPEELASHDCLHYANLSRREEWRLRGPEGPLAVEIDGRYCSNNGDALCQAAVAGLGIALLPGFIVADDLKAGRLVPLLEDYAPEDFSLYALYPSRHFVPAKIRLFLAFLAARLETAMAGS